MKSKKMKVIYKLSTALMLLSVILISVTACDGDKNDLPDPTSEFKKCDEITPMVTIQETYEGQLELNGFIWAQALQNVHHIELTTSGPSFGRLEGHTIEFTPNTGNIDGNVEGVGAWSLPFNVNETNKNYTIEVTYYCTPSDEDQEGNGVPGGDEGGSSNEPFEGFSTSFDFNPGNICDPGGESLFITESGTLVNGIPAEPVSDQISGQVFNIKWQIRPPSSVTEGFLFLYPLEEAIETAYLEMPGQSGENILTKTFNIEWYTEPWDIDDVYLGDLSYLSANINVTDLFAGMDEEEIGHYGSIKFVIKHCGGQEFSNTFQFNP